MRLFRTTLLIILSLLAACQATKPLADRSAWGKASNGLECRLYLDRTANPRAADRDALWFEIRNMSDHHIQVPVYRRGGAKMEEPVPFVLVHIAGHPEVISPARWGWAPAQTPFDLAPGEALKTRLAENYGIGYGESTPEGWKLVDLSKEPVSLTATFESNGEIRHGDEMQLEAFTTGGKGPFTPPTPCWKGAIESNAVEVVLR